MADRGRQLRRTDFSKGYHTFSLEWSKDYLFTYLDSRLQQILYWKFDAKKPMWDAGNFASQSENATLLQNPWANAGYNAPFDQSFFLVMNVAVGSTNGWFKCVYDHLTCTDRSINCQTGTEYRASLGQTVARPPPNSIKVRASISLR